MKVAECMTSNVETVSPDQPIREAAQFMLRADAGVMPVGDADHLVGMVTDRDIAVRAVAEGLGPDTPVRQVMTEDLVTCYDDEDVEAAAEKMSDAKVRRIAVLSREGDRLVGILSLADITRGDTDSAALALDEISEPGGEHSQSSES